MTDQELMENELLVIKGVCDLYMHGAIESTTTEVHTAFKEALQESLNIQNKLYNLMSERGWYKTETADQNKINQTKQEGKRVIAVGTTSCRVLETIADENGMVKETEGDTKIFIYPGYKFKCIDGLITNFHLPESTLVMLVSALAGREYILDAYKEAVNQKYRFFSFGDAMYIE